MFSFKYRNQKVPTGGDVRNPEFIFALERRVVEELLSVRVVLLLRNRVVSLESRLEGSGVASNLLGKLGTARELLHETTALVVLDVPFDFAAAGTVEDEADGALGLPDLARDVVTVAELVAETLAFGVDQETADTTESLGSQEL